MKKLLILLISYLFISPIHAKSITNHELLKTCKDPSLPAQNFCYGFIISAANAAQFYRNIVDIEHEFINKFNIICRILFSSKEQDRKIFYFQR